MNRESISVVDTGQIPIVDTGQCPVSTDNDPITPGQKRFRNQGKNTISSIVGSFKSVVTRHAHDIDPDFAWQSRFHDHVIRDWHEHYRIAHYIENNIANWGNDKFR